MIVIEKLPRECKPGDVIVGYTLGNNTYTINPSRITAMYFRTVNGNKYPWDVYAEDLMLSKLGNLNSSIELAISAESRVFILANEPEPKPAES